MTETKFASNVIPYFFHNLIQSNLIFKIQRFFFYY